jgi:hypothetical protein
MSVEELLQHVPPEVLYRRVPLAEDENALGPWREAIASYVGPGEDVQKLWDEAFDGRGDTVKPAVFPGGPEGDPIRKVLQQNQRTLELLEAGVRRGRFQFPELGGEATFDQDLEFLQTVRRTGQLLWMKAEECRADGEFAAAGRLLRASLGMGMMICNGDGFVVHYLIGNCVRGAAAGSSAGRRVSTSRR